MKYYFPIHLDGDNRGCEGIAKGTALLLGESKDKLIGLCRNIGLDTRLGIGQYYTMVPYVQLPFLKRVGNKFITLARKSHLAPNLKYFSIEQMERFIPQMQTGDIMLSTGGDMMCYGDNTPSVRSCELAAAKGCKTILWGCSMGPKNLTPIKEQVLRKFSLVYARESLTYDFFKSLGLENVVCLPDPAFVLEPEPTPLPECFGKGDVVGINLSNYTVGADHLNTPFGQEVKLLLDYILKQTDKQILLVPHVFWHGQDDRLISRVVRRAYPEYADRITILDGASLNYLQIRHIIGHCWCFIGGRTHAVVSAYSTCTPAIALGYSIKSRGIAKDLGLAEQLVIDCVNKIEPSGLLNSFKHVEAHHDEIKSHLQAIMPTYRQKPYEIREVLKNMGIL